MMSWGVSRSPKKDSTEVALYAENLCINIFEVRKIRDSIFIVTEPELWREKSQEKMSELPCDYQQRPSIV